MNQTYPFELKSLPYSYIAMEPYIDQETMILHHDKHLKNYIYKLNLAIAPYPKYYNWTLEKLLQNLIFLPKEIKESVKNNAGGVYNHIIYFDGLKNVGNKNTPVGMLKDKINKKYTNFTNFYNQFKEKALEVFGSGYAWLVLDKNNNLDILTTSNQDTVLDLNVCPILVIDVWEHAYYIKYHNLRAEYIDNYKNIINWDKAEKMYLKCIKKYT